jgi:hypothetical protein
MIVMKKIACTRYITLCCILLALASRSNAQDNTPMQVYNKLISAFMTMTDRAKSMSDKYTEAFPSRNWTAVKPYRISFQDFCTDNIKVLNDVKDAGGSYELRQATIKLFKLEQEITQYYTNFDEFDENTTAETVDDKKHKRETFFTNQVDPQITVFKQAFLAFVKANGIK